MSNITFRSLQVHDDRPLVDQKHAVDYVLTFAGIHDVTADNAVFDTGHLSNYSGYDVGIWSQGTGQLEAANGTSGWYPCMHNTTIEGSFSATFTKTGKGGFMFAGDSSDTYHTIWWTDERVGVSQITDTSEEILVSVPCTESGEANVTVGVYYQSHTAIDEVDDIAAGLWFDDMLLLAFAFPYVANTGKIGLAVKSDWVGTFQDLRVYDAHSIVPWTSIDPGETSAAGLSRVTAYTRLKLLARYDGSVRLYLDGYHTPDWSIPSHRNVAVQKQTQVHWPTHARTAGAIHEADTFRDGNQGHVFLMQNDPNALTASETETKGARLHKGMEGVATRTTVTMPPNVLLEPGDVVTLDGADWTVVTINYALEWRDGVGIVLQSTAQLVEALET